MNTLIQNGARPLVGASDLIQVLDPKRVGEHKSARKFLPSDVTKARGIYALGGEPIHVAEIRSGAALPIEQVSATLVLMKLKGMVRQDDGMHRVAVREDQAEYKVNK